MPFRDNRSALGTLLSRLATVCSSTWLSPLFCFASRIVMFLRDTVQPLDHRREYLVKTDCGRRTGIKVASVEILAEKWRHNFRLNSVLVDFPWTRAIKKAYTRSLSSERHMHRQTVPADQATMVLHVTQMFEERFSTGQHIDFEAFCFELPLQLIVVCPILHRPNRTGFGGD